MFSTLLSFLPSFTSVLFLAGGAAAGAMGYRWMLKRDPEKLEAWAQAAKRAGEKIKA